MKQYDGCHTPGEKKRCKNLCVRKRDTMKQKQLSVLISCRSLLLLRDDVGLKHRHAASPSLVNYGAGT